MTLRQAPNRLWAAVIVAAGRGVRFGRPKQFLEIAGVPMVGWSVRTFAQMPEIAELVVVTEPEWIDRMHNLVKGLAPVQTVRIVEGGATRQASVRNGLRSVCTHCEAVLVHDGARPLVRAHDVRAAMNEVRDRRAALLAAPVVDTIKIVAEEAPTVVRTLDRSVLWAAQTPQLALKSDLLAAHERACDEGVDATDDAALLERIGVEVVVVPASSENFKVTLPEDVARAEAFLLQMRGEERAIMRVGHGFDAHRLVEGRALILGGVRIPFERGALGHSDADIVAHAIADALLGASALGDLGARFPDGDPRWKDADSMDLLSSCAADVRAAGFAIANVDATIVVERPKLAPFVAQMRENVAARTGIAPECVSIKAKSSEGLGYTGDGSGIVAYAVALVTGAPSKGSG